VKDEIRDKMFQYVGNIDNLSEAEIEVIDSYISEVLDKITPILELQSAILSDKDKQEEFKELLINYMVETNNG
jgi:hypothetical protein